MSQAPAEPGRPDPRAPTGDDAAGHARTRWTLVVAALVVASLAVGAMVAVRLAGGDGGANPDGALQPDGTRLGPVSGSEQTPLPDGTLLAFHSDDKIDVHEYVGRPLVVNFWASCALRALRRCRPSNRWPMSWTVG